MTDSTVNSTILYPGNTWKISGIGFNFPQVYLKASERAYIVSGFGQRCKVQTESQHRIDDKMFSFTEPPQVEKPSF